MWHEEGSRGGSPPQCCGFLSGKLTPVAAAASQGELRKRKQKWLWTEQARRDVPFHDLGLLATEMRC